jgi:hypothetical protein
MNQSAMTTEHQGIKEREQVDDKPEGEDDEEEGEGDIRGVNGQL